MPFTMSGNNDGWSFNRFNEYEANLKGEKLEESTEEVAEEETLDESLRGKEYADAMGKLKKKLGVEDGKGMHREADTGKVVDKAEIGKIYYPNMPKKKSSVAKRKEAEAAKLKKEELEATGLFSAEEIEALVEGSVQLDEISLKTKMGAYAATKGPDSESEYGDKVHDQGERIKKNIVKKHGKEAGEHAEKHAEATHFGRGTDTPSPRIEKNRTYRTTKAGKMHGQDQNKLKSDLKKRSVKKEELEATGLFSAEEIEALVEASCGSKGYQKGGEVKCDKCEGKGCDHCEDKGTHKKSEKSGSKPDYLDFDKDGNKDEPMTKALKEKGAKKN